MMDARELPLKHTGYYFKETLSASRIWRRSQSMENRILVDSGEVCKGVHRIYMSQYPVHLRIFMSVIVYRMDCISWTILCSME